ncbi:hypothetical protein QBC39DRAFT_387176 [Podospora conica]|nr:hypothetical protein QBC39DRAFT_387176 [Schizothecium conicum]
MSAARPSSSGIISSSLPPGLPSLPYEVPAPPNSSLVFGTQGSSAQDRYDTLGEIAPTQQLELVGRALCRTDEAADLQAEVNFSDEKLLEAGDESDKQAIEDRATENFFIPVSEEQLNLLDAEPTIVLPIFIEASEFTGKPLFQALPSVQEGRTVALDNLTLVNFISSASAPGLFYPVDTTVPLFADTLGG